jgi:hypothetical protein
MIFVSLLQFFMELCIAEYRTVNFLLSTAFATV